MAAASAMPTTRAARELADLSLDERGLIKLPADVLGLVLYQLRLAHDIAAVAPTCHVLCDAAKLALKARPFSSEVLTLAGHGNTVFSVAAAPDGRVVTGLKRREVGLSVVFATIEGKEITIQKNEIERQAKSPASIMPTGFGLAIPSPDFRNLLEYLLGG